MDAAIAGLIDAAIGSVAGMAGTLITSYLQVKQEHAKWIHDKPVEACSNTIRYLVRALNKRSSLSIEDSTLIRVMGKDVIKEWFDDLSEIWFGYPLCPYMSPRVSSQKLPMLPK